MNIRYEDLRIDFERFLADFDALSQIGATGDGGVHRPALTPADHEARAWFARRAQESGLEACVDAAGNQSARLAGAVPGAPTFFVGSHLDSVPNGGRFDGALGVTAALEVLRVVKEQHVALPVHLEAINFTDEEGTLVGLLGSRALTGDLSLETLRSPKCGRAKLEELAAAAGLDVDQMPGAARSKDSIAGYLELHIEQGERLEKVGVPVGIVSGITGICAYRLTFLGRADHSGTRPIPERLDAGVGASGFLLAAREQVLRDYPGCTVNVGQIQFQPGAFNIVPERATLALEFRSPDARQLQEMEMAILKTARVQANRYNLELRTEHLYTESPERMAERAQAALAAAAEGLGLGHMRLPSFASHDAQVMARICPAGMLFVPSVDGASHSPREFTRAEDMQRGANVLLQAMLRMVSSFA